MKGDYLMVISLASDIVLVMKAIRNSLSDFVRNQQCQAIALRLELTHSTPAAS